MPEKTKDGVELIQSRPVFHLGRWISAIIVGLLALGLAYILVTNPQFRWDVVWKWLFSKMIITGLMMTIVLTVLSMALGTVLAITMAIMRQSINPVLRGVASAYIWFFRGTPIYTQLIFWSLLPTLYRTISLGIPGTEFGFSFETREWFTPFWMAFIGLGLNEGAYLAEIIRSAIPYTLELTFVANQKGQELFQPIPLLIAAAIWYLVVTSILMWIQSHIEAYFGKGFDPDNQSVDTTFIEVTP